MRIDSSLSSVNFQGGNMAKDVNPIGKTREVRGSDSGEPMLGETHKKEVSHDELVRAIGDINKSVRTYDRKLQYSIHEKTNTIMVKVIDISDGSDRVIREIPPEKILDMVAKMWELAGIIVDERV